MKKTKKILLWIALIISAMGFVGAFIDAVMFMVWGFSWTTSLPTIIGGLLIWGFLTVKLMKKLGLLKRKKK